MRGVDGKEDPFSLILPSLLDIGVMGHCKHKCPFCYQGHVSEPNMKLSDYIKIIESVKHHTNQVALGGRGDPNHHENFKEIVEYSRKNGVVPNYTTSGIDLTDDHIEISKMCGAVAVSDYGKDFTYNAIQRFIDAGIKTNIHMMLTKITYEKCIKILYGYNPWKYYNDEGHIESHVDIEKLNAVIFLLFKPAGAGETLGWQPTPVQIKKFSELVFAPQSKFKIGMDSCLINHVLKYAEPTAIQRMSLDTCEGGRMSAYITPDMKLMPCSFADKSLWATPITNENTIDHIWNKSFKFNSFRKILQEQSDCCPLNL
jgi:MoaA/NifB/PqqE/SkfB family radical SAM enzyme